MDSHYFRVRRDERRIGWRPSRFVKLEEVSEMKERETAVVPALDFCELERHVGPPLMRRKARPFLSKAGCCAVGERLEGRRLLSATLTTLAVFNDTTGLDPANLVMDGAGDLYGMTDTTVFEIAAGTHKVSTVATFNGTDYKPNEIDPDALAVDAAGNLYGTTGLGGDLSLNNGDGDGTVFRISAGTHELSTLAVFDGTNGLDPTGLISDAAGDLYGSTEDGIVFEIALGTHSLVALATVGQGTGFLPGGLVLDRAGDLYGVHDGSQPFVFEIPSGTQTLGTLATFPNSDEPSGGLVLDRDDNLYGSTVNGVYEISATTHAFSTLTADDDFWGEPVIDSDGDLFTVNDPVAGFGGVTEVAAGTRAVTSVAAFDGKDGSYPDMGLVVDSAGDLFLSSANANADLGTPNPTLAGGSVEEISGSGFVPASDSGPALIAQPTSETGVAGHAVGFAAAAGGYPYPTVQWQASTDGGKTFSDIAGDASATTQTLTITGLSASKNGNRYRAIFTNSLGSVTTNVAKLAVVPLAVISPAHASPSIVTGTTTTLSALADATSGEAGLTYKWSFIDAPAGAAKPTFSANNSNAARQVVATFHKDGRYLFGCIITDGEGITIKTDVQVDVSQTPTSLRLSPHHQTVAIRQPVTFRATVDDQFGHPLRTQPAIAYSILSGPGTIDSTTGLFSSPTPGAALIQAEDGDLSGTIGVQVIP
jgi:hypothetical protein